MSLENNSNNSQSIKINNVLIWILALSPIIGELLRGFIIGMVYGSRWSAMEAIAEGKLWFIPLVLNVALGIADEKLLAKNGIDTSKFKMWAVLIPVYLFQRTKMLNHNYAYFITWCVAFALMFFL
ncbi:hypothetical protein [Haemophilus parahaemolyticus]|uniref:hypothetical protein n=1 Tax=Haemophilus parahaemolyticus TaxID=735 RepID=UPI0024919CBA|nr:hypothetical protein [Haemophilus parahaemolyticus]